MENTLDPNKKSPEAPAGAQAGSDSTRFLESLLARMDVVAEQAFGGQGLDPRAREALDRAPLSAQAQAFRSKLTAALADKACELAETDPEAAGRGLARAARMLGSRHARIEQNRALASVAVAYPTLKAILASKMGSPAQSIAAKARKAREDQEREEEEKNAKLNLGKPAGSQLFGPSYEQDEDSALHEILDRLREHKEHMEGPEAPGSDAAPSAPKPRKAPKAKK